MDIRDEFNIIKLMFCNTKYPISEADGYRYIKQVPPGSGKKPVLVLLHGMFGGLSNFEALIDRFKDRCTIFVPEIPLYTFPSTNITIRKLTEWLTGVLNDHSFKQSIVLGNSMGGHLALDLALRQPAAVRALVLSGSSGLFEKPFGSTCPRRFDRDYIYEQASQTFYDDLVDDAMLDDIMEVLQNPRKLMRLLRVARSTHRYNMEELLPGIDKPALLIWGRQDKITPPETARQFEELLPTARLQWIDRCGHAPMMERPEVFCDLLEPFLKSLHGSSSLKRKPQTMKDNERKKDYSHI